jgi:hypothetical protein
MTAEDPKGESQEVLQQVERILTESFLSSSDIPPIPETLLDESSLRDISRRRTIYMLDYMMKHNYKRDDFTSIKRLLKPDDESVDPRNIWGALSPLKRKIVLDEIGQVTGRDINMWVETLARTMLINKEGKVTFSSNNPEFDITILHDEKGFDLRFVKT